MNAILKPALHTLWQAFVATLVAWWGAAGVVDVKAVHNVDDAKRFALSGAAAVLAALASAGYHTAREYGPRILTAVLPWRVNKAELASIYDVLDKALAAEQPPLPQLPPLEPVPVPPAPEVPPATQTAPAAPPATP